MSRFDWLAEGTQVSSDCLDDLLAFPEIESQFGGLGSFPGRPDPKGKFHPDHKDYLDILQLIGGYHFAGQARQVKVPRFDGYIPEIFPRNTREVPSGELGHIAVTYKQLGAYEGAKFNTESFEGKYMRRRNQVALITGNDKDHVLEKVWRASYTSQFWDFLRRIPNAVLLSPDFSVYTHYIERDNYRQTRFEQLLNMKRSLDFYLRSLREGFPSVLSIAFSIPRDLERWCDYLRFYAPNAEWLALNIQTLSWARDNPARTIKNIESEIGREMKWIVQGMSTRGGFEHFRENKLLNRVVPVGASDQVLAFYRRDRNNQVRQGVNPASLLVENVRATRQDLQDVRDGILRLPLKISDERAA